MRVFACVERPRVRKWLLTILVCACSYRHAVHANPSLIDTCHSKLILCEFFSPVTCAVVSCPSTIFCHSPFCLTLRSFPSTSMNVILYSSMPPLEKLRGMVCHCRRIVVELMLLAVIFIGAIVGTEISNQDG